MINIVPITSVTDIEIITPNVQRYVDDYVIYYTKCADAILGLAETCFNAKENLNKTDFKIFVSQVRLDSSNATLSKYLKIGSQSLRFRKIEDRLPSTWTVLYSLACLDNHDFINVLPTIHKDMTAKDLREALGRPNNSIPLVVPDITIKFTDKGTSTKRTIYFDLQELAIKYNFTLTLSNEFESEVLNIIDLKEVA
jgi:hypothetical protein